VNYCIVSGQYSYTILKFILKTQHWTQINPTARFTWWILIPGSKQLKGRNNEQIIEPVKSLVQDSETVIIMGF